MSDIEHAVTLLVMAAKDIKALKGMSDEDAFADEIFGFHAQQAVEKSLKAWISAACGTYGRTHDLKQLFLILQDLGCDAKRFESLAALTPFAVELRYEALESGEPKLDRASLTKSVEELHDHVQAVIELKKRQHA